MFTWPFLQIQSWGGCISSMEFQNPEKGPPVCSGFWNFKHFQADMYEWFWTEWHFSHYYLLQQRQCVHQPVCSKWCMQWNLNYKLWKLCHAIYEHSLTVLVISIRNSLLFLESKALEVGLIKCKVCDLQLPIRKLNVEWNRPPHTIYWLHLVKSWIFSFSQYHKDTKYQNIFLLKGY